MIAEIKKIGLENENVRNKAKQQNTVHETATNTKCSWTPPFTEPKPHFKNKVSLQVESKTNRTNRCLFSASTVSFKMG